VVRAPAGASRQAIRIFRESSHVEGSYRVAGTVRRPLISCQCRSLLASLCLRQLEGVCYGSRARAIVGVKKIIQSLWFRRFPRLRAAETPRFGP